MNQSPRQPSEFEEKIVQVNRVSKKTKGGNQMGFAVLVVLGDRKGRVGVALGKAPDVLSSIKKGIRKAKKRLFKVPMKQGSIPFRVLVKYGAAQVLLKPAPQGSGIIAGGAVRDVLEVAGYTNIVGKILGSNNQGNNAYATIKALQEIQETCRIKGLDFDSKPPVVKVVSSPIAPTLKPIAKVITPKNSPTSPATKSPKLPKQSKLTK
jgi:small subunit ribosomal protein S5